MTIRLDTNETGASILWMEDCVRLPILASDTGGSITTQLAIVPAGFANPPHVHTLEDEVFYVIDGRIEVRVAEKVIALQTGDMAYAPAGLPHQLTVVGEGPAKLLILMTSESIERAFIAAAGKSADAIKQTMGEAGVLMMDEFDPNYRPLGFELLNSDATIVRLADEGEAVWLAGDTYTIKLSGEETGERFAIVHFDIPPEGGPVPHIHTRDFEAFVITEGTVELYADGTILTGHVDDVAVLPTNIPHCFKNRTDTRAQMIAIVAPAGFDRFIRAVGQPAILGQTAPLLNDDEKKRLMANVTEFGLILRPDIHF